MSTLLEKDIQAITIEYLPTEDELDPKKPLVVGQGLLDSFRRTEHLGYKTFFGIKRYLTGLDELMVDIDNSLPEEEKKERKAYIRNKIEQLEKFFGKGNLDATNDKFWSEVKLDIVKKTTNLDLTNPRNELLFHCIKGGGFTEVAPTLEDALTNAKRFYLIEPIEFVENRVAPRKTVNRAIAVLEKLNESKSFDDIFFLAKYLMPVEKSYTKRTPKSLMYEDLDKYINGEVIRKSKTDCARYFMDATKKAKPSMIVHCILKDAIYNNFVYQNPSGELKNNDTGGIYGTTVEKAVEHLMGPAYEHELENLKERVEKIWSRE